MASDLVPTTSETPKTGALSGVVDGTKHLLNVIEKLDAEIRNLQQENLSLKNALSNAESQLSIQKDLSSSLKDENKELLKTNNLLQSQIEEMRSNPVLPLEVETSIEQPKAGKGTQSLEWEYLVSLMSCDNTMSELNNDRLFSCLQAFYLHDVIDHKFHLRRKVSNNVACYIASQLRSQFTTETKWSIYERLFGRKNLRTYENRPMSPHDRRICRQIDQIIEKAQMSE